MAQVQSILCLPSEIDEEKRNKLMVLRNNITEKLDNVKSLDEKLEALLIEDSGNAYEVEANEILEYHEQFYELFVHIDNKLKLKDEPIVNYNGRSVSSVTVTE